MNVGQYVDVVGVVDRIDQVTTINRKDGTEVAKRTLRLLDDTNSSIDVRIVCCVVCCVCLGGTVGWVLGIGIIGVGCMCMLVFFCQ